VADRRRGTVGECRGGVGSRSRLARRRQDVRQVSSLREEAGSDRARLRQDCWEDEGSTQDDFRKTRAGAQTEAAGGGKLVQGSEGPHSMVEEAAGEEMRRRP